MAPPRFSFTAELWEYEGQGAWHFVSLPPADADEIEATHGRHAKGFGSIPVEVTIGSTTWSTSIFPDKKRATYLLPVKKAVRTAEGLVAGTKAKVGLRVVQ
jgi:hypothetical protein